VLYHHDNVINGNNSHAKIHFIGDRVVSLASSCVYNVQLAGYSKTDSSNNQCKTNFVKGGLRFVTGQVGKTNPKNFMVSSPVATNGVASNGATFALNNNQTRMYLLSTDSPFILQNKYGITILKSGKGGRSLGVATNNGSMATCTKPQ